MGLESHYTELEDSLTNAEPGAVYICRLDELRGVTLLAKQLGRSDLEIYPAEILNDEGVQFRGAMISKVYVDRDLTLTRAQLNGLQMCWVGETANFVRVGGVA